MSNKAFRLHAKGASIESLALLFPDCVIREIINGKAGFSSMPCIIGARWRKEHGFGRPFHSGGGGGGPGGYKQRQAAAEAARRRKTQKASRVRSKIANGLRSAGIMVGLAMMKARKAARGS